MNRIIIFFLSLFILSSCQKNNELKIAEEQLETDTRLIQNYLDANNLSAQSTPSGLHFIVEQPGNGAQPTFNQSLRIRYKSYLLDETIIAEVTGDSSIVVNTSSVIVGIQESLSLLREGGKGIFFLPSNLAFGTQPSDNIPANSVIIFELELIEIITPARQLEIDTEIIRDYLSENNLTADSLESGIYYFFEEEGEGDQPTTSSTVTVKYKGYFLNGEVFDETTGDNTARFPLSGVIEGWQQGIPLFKKGGKGTLLIPSALAYGTAGVQQIPPNTVLLFDIELVEFE